MMELNLEKNTITLYGKAYKYDMFLKKLASLSGEEIYHFISNRGIALPRKMNCLAMYSVLNDKIKYLHSKSLSKDYFQRLQHYHEFGETQLVELFNNICDEADYDDYRFNLMNLIIMNYEQLQLNDGELQYLKNLKKTKLEDYANYVNYISACSLEQEGTFDGIEIETLKNNLLLTSTLKDIVSLGEKYGIEIPEHLTKEEYLAYILYYLEKNGSLTDDIKTELESYTLANLSTYSRRNGIPLQPSLSKEDSVTYLFYYLDGCEIATTSIEEIIKDSFYDPIKFSIDLSQINVFGGDEAKRIIKFDGDDNPEYNEKINKIIEDLNKEPELEFIQFDETKSIAAPIKPGEKHMSESSADFELEDYEIEDEKENSEPEVVALEEITEPEPTLEEPKEEENTIVEEKIDINNVIVNDLYGSKKLKDLKNGNRKIVILSISLSVLVLALGFVIFALVR